MMRDKYLCVATFREQDNGAYSVKFPSLDGCMTFGSTLEDAYEKALDACAGWILVAKKNNVKIPDIECQLEFLNSNSSCDKEFNNLFLIDLLEFNKKINKKAVKKNLTMPAWLCELADERKINYSKVLQSAIKEMLDIENP